MADQSLLETETAQFNGETISDADIPGVPSAYSCPDCHGTLWEVREGELVRFRCRVGHAFSVESLLAAQSDAVEEAMWTAYRALKESAALARRMAQRAVHQKLPRVARQLQEQCDDAESRAKLIEEVLRGGEIIKPEPMEAKVVP